MALQELDLISKTPGMETDILLHESLLPRNKNLNFWSENLAAFFRCGGQVKDLEDSNDPTASSVLSTQLATIFDNVKTFTKNGVTQLSQVIDHIKPSGAIVPLTHSEFKVRNNLKRNVLKRKYEKITELLPDKVSAPKAFRIGETGDYYILDECCSETPSAKRLKKNEFQPEIYEKTDEASALIESVANLVELQYTQMTDFLFKIEGEKDFHKTNEVNLRRTVLVIGEETIPLVKLNSSRVTRALSTKITTKHRHSPIWDEQIRNETYDFSTVPNRRQHPSLPKYLYTMRYLTLHNKHWIGDRLKHIPGVQPSDLLCRDCGQPIPLPHLLYQCNHIKPLYDDLFNRFGKTQSEIPSDLSGSCNKPNNI